LYPAALRELEYRLGVAQIDSCQIFEYFAIFQVSQDVPMIIQMIGPHPKQFAGKSERVDELIKIISRKVPA